MHSPFTVNFLALKTAAAQRGLTSFSDVAVLLVVAEEAVSATQLSILTETSTAAITGRLDKLEALGLIARKPTPGDRRQWSIEATPEGAGIALALRQCLEDQSPAPMGA